MTSPLAPFGLDLSGLYARFDTLQRLLEEHMATETEQLSALHAKVDDVIADVRAALAILTAERDNLGAEGQAALDALTAKVDAFDTEVGDQDGSETPV